MTLDKTFKSFAKINIGLSIPFKYSNNYHHIVSIFEPVDIYDEIKIKIMSYSNTQNLLNKTLIIYQNYNKF